MKTQAKVLIIVVFAGLLVLAPVFTIWSLNLLFGLAIPVTLKTWLATAWLGGTISGIFMGVAKASS